MAKNDMLAKAKEERNNEFYTRFEDIEKELKHYRDHFKDAVIYCNCDDPTYSNFWKYFNLNFERLGLKKLICTHFDANQPTYLMEYSGGNDADTGVGIVTPLKQNGDFRSPECIELLKEADVIVTNPPFSLFREYVAQLMQYHKKFLILGNNSAVNYKEFFPLLKNGEVWTGTLDWNDEILFRTSPEKELYLKEHKREGSAYRIIDGILYARAGVLWYTNLDYEWRHRKIVLTDTYTPEKYPKFDNYNAINVYKMTRIPKDYDGYMGVPVSFICRLNPDQFELIGMLIERNCPEEYGFIQGDPVYISEGHKKYSGPVLHGRALFPRLIIRRK